MGLILDFLKQVTVESLRKLSGLLWACAALKSESGSATLVSKVNVNTHWYKGKEKLASGDKAAQQICCSFASEGLVIN